jgi:hypothetical protein
MNVIPMEPDHITAHGGVIIEFENQAPAGNMLARPGWEPRPIHHLRHAGHALITATILNDRTPPNVAEEFVHRNFIDPRSPAYTHDRRGRVSLNRHLEEQLPSGHRNRGVRQLAATGAMLVALADTARDYVSASGDPFAGDAFSSRQPASGKLLGLRQAELSVQLSSDEEGTSLAVGAHAGDQSSVISLGIHPSPAARSQSDLVIAGSRVINRAYGPGEPLAKLVREVDTVLRTNQP